MEHETPLMCIHVLDLLSWIVSPVLEKNLELNWSHNRWDGCTDLVQRLQSGPYELYKEISNKPPQIETGWCMPNRLIDLSTLWALKKSGKKMVYWCRNIKFWISHCLIVGVQVTSETDVVCHKSNVKPSRSKVVLLPCSTATHTAVARLGFKRCATAVPNSIHKL